MRFIAAASFAGMLVTGAVLWFVLPSRSALATQPACVIQTGTELECPGCASVTCGACNNGACPGTRTRCRNNSDTKPVAFGWSAASPATLPCFEIWRCEPVVKGTQSCDSENYCTGVYTQISSSTSTFIGWEYDKSACPPPNPGG